MTETDARIDFTHRADRDDARPHKLTFQVVAAMPGTNGLKKSRVAASEGKKGDFVNRANKRRFQFFAQELSCCAGEGGKMPNEIRAKDIEMIGPTVMPDVPDDLGSGLSGGADDWLERWRNRTR